MTVPRIDLRCVRCQAVHDGHRVRYTCDCGGTLDVVLDTAALRGRLTRDLFDERLGSKRRIDRSGVWRFRELILPLPEEALVARPEGNTNLYDSPVVARWVGLDSLLLKHEGENPTGSFKDRGMAVGITAARHLGSTRVACASTGNTSASMASYAALVGMRAYVFIPEGKIAHGKLSQALAYGARTIQIDDDFDGAMRLVQEVCAARDVYLLNSVNPFRIEGQKAIVFEILQDLDWVVPDWIVLPGGNLGNNSAIAKGLVELREIGMIERLPRMAVVQATGANPLYTAWSRGEDMVPVRARTIATAIRIGDPVSWRKSLRGLGQTAGLVEEVTDAEILEAKAVVDAAGIGAEPASCATVAGLRRLLERGVIGRGERVVGILTGHLLKDPGVVVDYHLGQLEGIEGRATNPPVSAPARLEAVLEAMGLDASSGTDDPAATRSGTMEA